MEWLSWLAGKAMWAAGAVGGAIFGAWGKAIADRTLPRALRPAATKALHDPLREAPDKGEDEQPAPGYGRGQPRSDRAGQPFEARHEDLPEADELETRIAAELAEAQLTPSRAAGLAGCAATSAELRLQRLARRGFADVNGWKGGEANDFMTHAGREWLHRNGFIE